MSDTTQPPRTDGDRRRFLAATLGAAAAGLGMSALGRRADAAPPGAPAPAPVPAPAPPAKRAPVVFVGHGSPMAALDATRGGEWQRWAASWGGVSGILVVSAHWQDVPVAIGATQTVPLVYDMYGFPDALYEVKYPA